MNGQCVKAKKQCEWYNNNCTGVQKSKNTSLKKRRCPRGSRRDKKTRKCVSRKTGKSINTHTSTKSISTVRAYSPSINKELTRRRHPAYTSPFGCGMGTILTRTSPNYRKAVGEPKVQIGVRENGEPICVGWKTKAAQDVMLKNMNLDKIDCSRIIAPAQKHSNCWFNTMFMAFFISDKGRKFFKFFREQMIKGVHFVRAGELGAKKFTTKPISPPSLRKAFFLFNAAIDASLRGAEAAAHDLLADTNNLIAMIYKSIRRNAPKTTVVRRGVRDVRKAGNPYAYYNALVTYLGGDQVSSSRHGVRMIEADSIKIAQNKTTFAKRPPDVVAISTDEGSGKFNLPNTFKLSSSSGEEADYTLDSMIVRDTDGRHFCALLTCNGQGYGFDGESYKRMLKYDWKARAIEQAQSWSFKGSVWEGTDTQIKWKLSKAYSIAFYYRV